MVPSCSGLIVRLPLRLGSDAYKKQRGLLEEEGVSLLTEKLYLYILTTKRILMSCFGDRIRKISYSPAIFCSLFSSNSSRNCEAGSGDKNPGKASMNSLISNKFLILDFTYSCTFQRRSFDVPYNTASTINDRN